MDCGDPERRSELDRENLQSRRDSPATVLLQYPGHLVESEALLFMMGDRRHTHPVIALYGEDDSGRGVGVCLKAFGSALLIAVEGATPRNISGTNLVKLIKAFTVGFCVSKFSQGVEIYTWLFAASYVMPPQVRVKTLNVEL